MDLNDCRRDARVTEWVSVVVRVVRSAKHRLRACELYGLGFKILRVPEPQQSIT